MRGLPLYITLALICTAPICTAETKGHINISELALEQYWNLLGIDNLQPSGLSFCGSELVMVSDRHNLSVFSIPLSNTVSTQVNTFRSIVSLDDLPEDTKWQQHFLDWALRWTSKRYDWEGIHCNDDRSLYLASETFSSVAKIEPNGRSRWIIPNLSTEIQNQGFASTLNTGFEGISANTESVLIALEREPRGLMRMSLNTSIPLINKIQSIDQEGVTSPLSADFTGLWLELNAKKQPKIFTLERNYFRVCRRSYESWIVEVCWSYQTTEKAPEFRFENDHYGLAEGIARLGEHIYIVLDNNGEPRQQSGNKSPLLFKFKRPDNW